MELYPQTKIERFFCHVEFINIFFWKSNKSIIKQVAWET